MNRTIKDAAVKRFHYDDHSQLRTHLADFMAAYNSEPPRVYRRVCGSMIRLLFHQRSSLRRMPPLLRSA